MRLLNVLMAILPLFFYASSYAQVGELDPDFGNGTGHVVTNFIPDVPSQGYEIVVQEDGKILAGGYTQGASGPGTGYPVLARYMPDGTPDNSFNGNGKMIGSIAGYSNALAIQPDGKIVQPATVYDGIENKLGVYRYNADGSPDNSFDTDGKVETSFGTPYLSPKAVALQPDGKIIVGGYVGYPGDTLDKFLVARYLPDGSPDASWDEDGIVTTQVGESWTDIKSILVQPDGKIVAIGYAVFNDFEDFAVVRYNNNGTLDQGFGDHGVAHLQFSDHDDGAVGGGLLPDGRIVLGGQAYNNALGKYVFAAARLNPDGTPDLSFHGDGMATLSATNYSNGARWMMLQPDGKILVGGYAHLGGAGSGGADMTIVRFTDNGIPDITFSEDGIKVYEDGVDISSEIQSMAFQNDGKIVMTGYSRVGGLNTMRVSRILTDVTLAANDPQLILKNISVFPNPIAEEINIEFELDRSEKISISLCDMHGKLIQQLMIPEEMSLGNHQMKFGVQQFLVAGSYLVNIETERGTKAVMVTSH